MGTVAHDHIFRQPGHVVNGLLPVLRGVLLYKLLGGDHAQHIRQRYDAPAIQQPQQEVHIEVGLHAPHNGPVAVLLGHALFLGIGLLGKTGDLPVRFNEFRNLAADGHIVGFRVQGQVGAEDLGVVGLIHVQPFLAVLGGDIHPLGALEVVLPVPLLAGVLLDEGNGIADLLGGVLLHVLFPVAQRGGQLEAGNAVLQLQALGDNAVAHQRAVAGGVALNGAGTQNGGVIVNGHTGLCLGHGAHVTGQAEFLGNVNIMQGGGLIQEHRDIGGGGLPAQTFQSGEAHHHGGHLILVHQHHFFGELGVVADAAVAPEQVVQKLCHILDDQILLCVADAQVFSPEPLGVPVHHHGNGQVVGHPAIAEHGLDVPGLDDEACQSAHNAQPALVVVHGVLQAAPFPAFADLAVGVKITQTVCADFFSHGLHLPESS